MLNYILDFIAPRYSITPETVHTYISSELQQNPQDRYKKLSTIYSAVFEKIYIAASYESFEVQSLIQRVKFNGEFAVAQELADYMYVMIYDSARYFIPNPDIIIPVPCDPRRIIERGYHVPYLIANQLSKRTAAPVQSLFRKKYTTVSQVGLEKTARRINLHDAFELNEPEINMGSLENGIVWIVDDLVTTGATIYEAAKMLKHAYPFVKIYGVVFAG